MSIRISDTEMSSDITKHTARYLANVPHTYAWAPPWGWSVSWMPERALTQNEAVTAMTIAEHVAGGSLLELGSTQEAAAWWGHVDNWAAELGLTGPHAVAEASLSPEDHAVAFTPDGQP